LHPKGSDPALDDALAGAIAGELRPRATVSAADGARLFARIEGAIGFGDDHQLMRAGGGDWRVLAERVFVKVLQRDAHSGQATYLVRYSPGTSFPRHPQRSVEECMLVAGDLRIGDTDMKPGDLQIAVPGIEHGPLISERGALVFVRGVLSRVPEERAPAFELLP
jgi:anti-sigma factor ChrR (cupin superfamily)